MRKLKFNGFRYLSQFFLLISLGILLITSCSEDFLMGKQNADSVGDVFPLTASLPGGQTRADILGNSSDESTVKIRWNSGDQIILTDDGYRQNIYEAEAGGSNVARFVCVSPTYVPSNNAFIQAFYPGNLAVNNSGGYQVDYAHQGGLSVASIASKSLMYATARYVSPMTLNFVNATAIIKLTMTFPQGAKDLNNVELYSASGDLVNGKAIWLTYNGKTTEPQWTCPRYGGMKATFANKSVDAGGKLVVYMLGIPQENIHHLTVLATNSDSTEAYSSTFTEPITFENKYLPLEANMTKAALTPEGANMNVDGNVWVVYGKNTSKVRNALMKSSNKISLIMPNVTSLQASAFESCNQLSAAYFPNVRTVGREAFRLCWNLSDANMPEATAFTKNTFAYCSNLTTINLPKLTDMGDGWNFYRCSKLTDVNFGSVIKTVGVANFYDRPGFSGASLVNIHLNNGQAVQIGIPFILASNKFGTETFKKIVLQNTMGYQYSEMAVRPKGMESTATQLAKKIFLGWNLGNTMEVGSGETGWGNPMTTQEIIDAVKKAGFNAVRIPCTWSAFVDPVYGTDYKIKDDRMQRVKEIIDYCMKDSMYVLLNTHHDWIERACDASLSDASVDSADDKIVKIWSQIANEFKDYDEHLMFACTNEPNGARGRWWALLRRYEQTFVDVVRSTGSNNAYRTLVIQGPSTNITETSKYMAFPSDPTPASQMVEVHDYTPPYFCMYNASDLYLWGAPYAKYGKSDSRYQEDFVLNDLAQMKPFADQGIPIVLGEYGALLKTQVRTDLGTDAFNLHIESRAYWMKYVTEHAKDLGYIPFLWDDGAGFNLLDRRHLVIQPLHQPDIKALVEGAAAGKYPF